MDLILEKPDYEYFLRGANAWEGLVNDRRLTRSFLVAPDRLAEDWPVRDAGAMQPADLDAALALEPEAILLGSGAAQVFPPPAVMAACLQRGVGLEVMTNAAVARTYTVMASEQRRVVAAFILPG